jgi:DNA polymerase-3 subunit gamma/tau
VERPGAALELLAGLHRDGAEPGQILADLAEAVHTTTRAKTLGAAGAGEGLSSEDGRAPRHSAIACRWRSWPAPGRCS